MNQEYLDEHESQPEKEEKRSINKNTVLLSIILTLLLALITFIVVVLLKPKEDDKVDVNENSSATQISSTEVGAQGDSEVNNGSVCPICKAAGFNPADETGYLSCNNCGARWTVTGQKIIIVHDGKTIEIPIVIEDNQPSNPDAIYVPQGSPQGNQGNVGQQGGANQQGNVGQQGENSQTPPVNTDGGPLAYDKAQLVEFYNTALKKSYTYKLNATKIEQVDVAVSGIDIGNLNLDADQFAQNIIANNTKKNGVKQTKSFVNGKATDDGSAVQQFVLPTNLYADAVQNISIAQHNGGYKMVIKLKAETCAHNGTAKYNASCTWPLDVGVIDFGQAVTIQECTFNYPGTVLTALIDAQGRVYAVQTEMPLNVTNAKAKAVGVTINVGSIRGKWTCKNELKFF